MLVLGVIFGSLAATAAVQPVLVQVHERSIVVNPSFPIWPTVSGSVRYLLPGYPDDVQRLTGIPIMTVVEALGGMGEEDLLWVIGEEGALALSRQALASLGVPLLVFGEEASVHFLAPDGEVTPEEVRAALGEEALARVPFPGVQALVVNGDGPPLPEVGRGSEKASLTVVSPSGEHTWSLAELEAHFVSLTLPGTYITSGGRLVSALWTGIPLPELLGSLPEDVELEVIAADGYRMRYRYGQLEDSRGVWILAFKQDGKYLPFNPGYFRIVKVGPENPRFPSSASAKMVTQIVVRGGYEDYSLRLSGALKRVLSRWELERGVACPCHAVSVRFTHMGETHTYTGFPLWRLLAYVDDELAPPPEKGVYYDDALFNEELARSGYTVKIVGADGFSLRVASQIVLRNDLLIIALKVDGRFLTKEEGGPLLFVWDHALAIPGLKKVKEVVEIRIVED